jgi:hypothetical protein
LFFQGDNIEKLALCVKGEWEDSTYNALESKKENFVSSLRWKHKQSLSLNKGTDEILDLALSPKDTIMAFTKNIGLKGEKEVEGLKIVFSVGKQVCI